MELRLYVVSVLAAACTRTDHAQNDGFDADNAPRLVLEEVQRIGSVDDPDYGFSSIGRVDVDEEDNIHVFERRDVELRVYAPDGRLLHRIGRRGGGPGEFSNGFIRFGVRDSTIWTYDERTRRLALFDRDGTVRSDSRIEEVPAWHGCDRQVGDHGARRAAGGRPVHGRHRSRQCTRDPGRAWGFDPRPARQIR